MRACRVKNDKTESDTSGRTGGLICEPLKAVWPAYAGTHVGVAVMKFFSTPLLPLKIISHRAKPVLSKAEGTPRPQSVNFNHPPWRPLRLCASQTTIHCDKNSHRFKISNIFA